MPRNTKTGETLTCNKKEQFILLYDYFLTSKTMSTVTSVGPMVSTVETRKQLVFGKQHFYVGSGLDITLLHSNFTYKLNIL